MITKEKGYSLNVLIITIAVMLILASTAIVTMRNLTKDREITQFMSDLQEVEQFVKEYYSTKNTLPIVYNDGLPVPILLTQEMQTQEHLNDKGEYFLIDLDKLGKINLYDDNRGGYILNESSLNVYVLTPTSYNNVKYYTLTDELLGINKTYGVTDAFQVIVAGNPITWVGSAKLTVSIPDHDDVDKDINHKWNFKYYKDGPISAEQFKTHGTSFNYGDVINISQNGIYSIYAEDPNGYVKVVNVVVTKIDENKPSISLVSGNKIAVGDDETGIKSITCTMSGLSSSIEKDVLTFSEDYAAFSAEYAAINMSPSTLEETIAKQEAIEALNKKYPQFQYNGVKYGDNQTNLTVHVEDYAGNKNSLSGVSRNMILNSNL